MHQYAHLLASSHVDFFLQLMKKLLAEQIVLPLILGFCLSYIYLFLHFAGIAPNMMLAKVCSDQNKPNGQYSLPSDVQCIMHFVQKLPIRKVCPYIFLPFWIELMIILAKNVASTFVCSLIC
jgi:hypothetical protein